MTALDNKISNTLNQLTDSGSLRKFYPPQDAQQALCQLSSNDYLGLADSSLLKKQFFEQLDIDAVSLSASSSRLLTGNFTAHEDLEALLSASFQSRSAVVFNSGYHMNIGILPALCDKQTLILADKYIHASLIDGARLSDAKLLRFRHNDLQHLDALVAQHHRHYETIIVVVESIYSMDGDVCDLKTLCQIKKRYPNICLYVDEAHAIGVRGAQGLGVAEEYDVIKEIDFLVGTFGKALASQGGYLICDAQVKTYLINSARPLIYSTALPPLNMLWSAFVWSRLPLWADKRAHLAKLGDFCRTQLQQKGFDSLSSSHIIPIILKDNDKTVLAAERLQQQGFWVLPIRSPSVPANQARLRLSLHADLTKDDIHAVVAAL